MAIKKVQFANGTVLMDVSNDTVEANDILQGKTAHNSKGEVITGSLPNNGSFTGSIAMRDGSVTIPAGYHDGTGSVTIDNTEKASIIPSNIREGATILGVEGTLHEGAQNPQYKEVTPTFSEQSIVPDTGYDTLSEVGVKAIPVRNEVLSGGGTHVIVGSGSGGGGEGGIPTITISDWNALTTSEKQSYGYVGIIRNNTGFKRGDLIYGADYVDTYLTSSDQDTIITEARMDNYDPLNLTWGSGSNPIIFTDYTEKDTSEDAVSIKTYSSSANTLAYVDLGANNTAFTAYMIVRMVTGKYKPSGRIISLAYDRTSRSGPFFSINRSNVNYVQFNIWDSDSNISKNPLSDYIAIAMKYDPLLTSDSSTGFVYMSNGEITTVNKTPGTVNRYLTIGRSDINMSLTYESCESDLLVKYLAVTNIAESNEVIQNNILNLVNIYNIT